MIACPTVLLIHAQLSQALKLILNKSNIVTTAGYDSQRFLQWPLSWSHQLSKSQRDRTVMAYFSEW